MAQFPPSLPPSFHFGLWTIKTSWPEKDRARGTKKRGGGGGDEGEEETELEEKDRRKAIDRVIESLSPLRLLLSLIRLTPPPPPPPPFSTIYHSPFQSCWLSRDDCVKSVLVRGEAIIMLYVETL